MTEIKKRAFVAMVGLVSAGLFSVGCSSSSNTTGTAGSTGSAGKAGGTAGTSGNAGTTGTGTGGSGGGASACVTAPTSGLIADFMGADGGIEIGGAFYGYGGIAKPLYTVTTGNLNIAENNGAASAAQYVGILIGFTSCVDASAFSGVEFNLAGSYSGCMIEYSTNDVQHDDLSTDPKGSCTDGSKCYSPQAMISSVTSSAQLVMEPWITSPGGDPVAATDTTMLTAVQWQFTIPAAPEGGTPGSCVADLNITDVKFYH